MQILINGTIQGLLISLLAIGFSIVYNSTGIIYVAQGAIYAISPFLLLSFLKFGMGIPFAVFFTFAITVFLSMSFEKINHWPLYKKEASPLIQLISSLGIYIIITLSLNLLIGYSGLFQLAHAAYYGIGAYTTALLMVRYGWGFVPSLISSIFVTGALTLIAIPEILRFLYIPDSIAANIRLLIYGLLLITIVHLRPQGLAGKYRFK